MVVTSSFFPQGFGREKVPQQTRPLKPPCEGSRPYPLSMLLEFKRRAQVCCLGFSPHQKLCFSISPPLLGPTSLLFFHANSWSPCIRASENQLEDTLPLGSLNPGFLSHACLHVIVHLHYNGSWKFIFFFLPACSFLTSQALC